MAPSLPPGGDLTNTATVSSTTSDPDSSNNIGGAASTRKTPGLSCGSTRPDQAVGQPEPASSTRSRSTTRPAARPTPSRGGQPELRQRRAVGRDHIASIDNLPLDPKKAVVQFVSPQCIYTVGRTPCAARLRPLPAGAAVTFVIEAQVGQRRHVTNTATLTSATPTR